MLTYSPPWLLEYWITAWKLLSPDSLPSRLLTCRFKLAPHLTCVTESSDFLRSSTLLSSVAVSFPQRLVVPRAAEPEILDSHYITSP